VSKSRDDPGHGFSFAEEQDSGIAGGVAGLKIEEYFLALYGGKRNRRKIGK
jgi:hypothetical protein